MTDSRIITTAELLNQMRQGWDDFHVYLNTLTDHQKLQLRDASGWTVKDHVMHLAVWEDGANALLERKPRREPMGLDQATWESGDYDRMNAVIQQRYKDKSWADVIQTFSNIHERLIAKIEILTDADLQRPYNDYQPGTTSEMPIAAAIMETSCAHYVEHRPWIEAIVAP